VSFKSKFFCTTVTHHSEHRRFAGQRFRNARGCATIGARMRNGPPRYHDATDGKTNHASCIMRHSLDSHETTARTGRPSAVSFAGRDEGDHSEAVQYCHEHTNRKDCALPHFPQHTCTFSKISRATRSLAYDILQRPLRCLCTICF
jgi:hypothetical protein